MTRYSKPLSTAIERTMAMEPIHKPIMDIQPVNLLGPEDLAPIKNLLAIL